MNRDPATSGVIVTRCGALYLATVNVTLPIPDDLAARLGSAGDVARRALEAFAAAECLAGRLNHSELRRLLGFGTHAELDGFLKDHGLFEDYTLTDLDRDRQDLQRLGFWRVRVVADTGPLPYLLLVGQIDLMPKLFGGLIVPKAVHAELLHSAPPGAVRRWAADPPEWLTISQTPPYDDPMLQSLDKGEEAAISLALSVCADLVLIDDRAGVTVARDKGLAVKGTLGILDLAGSRGLIDVAEVVARLKATNFRYRPELLNELVARLLGRP